MGRLAAWRNRLTYANVVASLALFAALGGASYAAVAVPAGSVGPRQLSFSIGMKSATGRGHRIRVSICPPGEHCPPPFITTLASATVSLKKGSKLLVVGEVDVIQHRSGKRGQTFLDIGEEFHRTADLTRQYTLNQNSTPVYFSDVLSARKGRQTVKLVADLQSGSGPPRTASFVSPRITIIALPPLPS